MRIYLNNLQSRFKISDFLSIQEQITEVYKKFEFWSGYVKVGAFGITLEQFQKKFKNEVAVLEAQIKSLFAEKFLRYLENYNEKQSEIENVIKVEIPRIFEQFIPFYEQYSQK